MKDAAALLLKSRKFLLVLFGIMVDGAIFIFAPATPAEKMVAIGAISGLIAVHIHAIGAEDAAEKGGQVALAVADDDEPRRTN